MNGGVTRCCCSLRLCWTRFGFGILEADTIVGLARGWASVPEAAECRVAGRRVAGTRSRGAVTEADVAEVVFSVTCSLELEHVEAVVTVQHPSRGQLEVSGD